LAQAWLTRKALLQSLRHVTTFMLGLRGVSPEMALRISTVFGGTPEIWLRLQAKYDLEIAGKKISRFKLIPYSASA
jgi:antitoxin HigA-1